MAELLKGKPVVDSMALDLRARIEALGRAKVVPALALVRVGQRPDDLSYERTARKRAESLGIAIRPYELDEFAPQAAIEAAIHEVNRDENVHGCLLFRPLPSFVDESHMCELLDPKKDIDGITLASLASVFTDGHAGYPPATAAACIQLLDHYQVPLQGKHVVVVGRSLVVGKPVSMMLLRRNASVTICHSKTENLADIMRSADVVICATGRARTFGAQFFGPGSDGARRGHQLRHAGKPVRRRGLRRGRAGGGGHHAGAGRHRHGHHVGDDGAYGGRCRSGAGRAHREALDGASLFPDGPQVRHCRSCYLHRL